ncbi:MAG TPA: DUF5719 family protein [Nocardioidaceae bacterium]|nr:DUF5719 family protein [Nocardioidaceae bacterium]
MTGRRMVAAAVGILALAVSGASMAAVQRSRAAPPPVAAAGTTVAVRSALLACPQSPTDRSTRARLIAVAPPGGSAGSVGVDAFGAPPAQQLADATSPGATLSRKLVHDRQVPAVLVRGSGGGAPGLTAAQWSTYSGPAHSGLAASWCLAPATSWWFAGVSTRIGTTSQLVVSNPSPALAVFDVQLFGHRGAIDAVGARGIGVAPHSRTVLDLARFAPSRAALTLHVIATTGRVAAAVRTTSLRGITPVGSEWVPPAAQPAPRALVGPAPGGRLHRQLVVTNPGDRQAVVSLRFAERAGTFTSTKVRDLSIPPGGVVTRNIEPALGTAAGALRLTSNVAVTAAVVETTEHGPRDFAIAPASVAIGPPAVVPLPRGLHAVLTLVDAGERGTGVKLTAFGARGRQLAQQQLALPAGSTRSWRPGKLQGARYLVVSPSAGSSVYGVVAYSSAAGVAALPLMSSPRSLVRPPVRPAW